MEYMKTMLLAVVLVLVGCGSDPAQGTQGEPGTAGAVGAAGAQGSAGVAGPAGKDGAPGKDGAAATIDGSRIKARYLVSDDGARELLGWHDTMLDADCSFMVASDGATRCLPGTKYIGNQAAIYYSDDTCTVPVVFRVFGGACAQPAPKYGIITDAAACPSTSTVYELGAPVTAPPSMFRVNAGTCEPVGPSGDLYAYVAPIAAASFVSAVAK